MSNPFLVANFAGAVNTALEAYTPDTGLQFTKLTGASGAAKLDGAGKAFVASVGQTLVSYVCPSLGGFADVDASGSFLFGTGSQVIVALRVRASTSVQTGYEARLDIAANQLNVYRINTGTYTAKDIVLLGTGSNQSPNNITLTNGQTYTLRYVVIGDRHFVYLNGNVVSTFKDTDGSAITGDGAVGFSYYDSNSGGTGTGWKVFGLQATTLLVPTLTAETKSDGSVNLTWTPNALCTQYQIGRGSSGSGPFTQIATPTSSPYNDPNPGTGAVYYQLTPVRTGLSGFTPVVRQVPMFTTGISTSKILAKWGNRVNQLSNGTATINSDIQALETWTTRVNGTALFGGPVSANLVRVLADFKTGLGPLTLSAPGTGTTTATGGTLTYTGTSTLAVWNAIGVTYSAPSIVIEVECTVTAGNLGIGIGNVSAVTGILAEFSASANTIQVKGQTNSAVTTFGTPSVTPSGAFKFALELLNNVVSLWVNTAGTWSIVATYFQTQNSAYDLTKVGTLLTGLVPQMYVYDGGSGINIAVTKFQVSAFNGPGYGRETMFVKNLDGSPYQKNGLLYAGFDRCTKVVNGQNVAQSVGFQLQPYNPVTATFYAPVGSYTAQFASGQVGTIQDSDFVYDANLDGFHVFFLDWSTQPPAPTGSAGGIVNLYYQFVAGDAINGTFHFASPTLVTLPSAITSPPSTLANLGSFYAPSVLQINGTWYFCGTHGYVDLSGNYHFNTTVLSGTSPSTPTTVVAEDIITGTEEVNFAKLGSKLYVIGGGFRNNGINAGAGQTTSGVKQVEGHINVWDFSDLSTLVSLGEIIYPNPFNRAELPAQPAMLVYGDGLGNGIIQLVVTDDTYYQGVYACAGLAYVFESSYQLQGWQDAVYAGQGQSSDLTSQIGGAGKRGITNGGSL